MSERGPVVGVTRIILGKSTGSTKIGARARRAGLLSRNFYTHLSPHPPPPLPAPSCAVSLSATKEGEGPALVTTFLPFPRITGRGRLLCAFHTAPFVTRWNLCIECNFIALLSNVSRSLHSLRKELMMTLLDRF